MKRMALLLVKCLLHEHHYVEILISSIEKFQVLNQFPIRCFKKL